MELLEALDWLYVFDQVQDSLFMSKKKRCSLPELAVETLFSSLLSPFRDLVECPVREAVLALLAPLVLVVLMATLDLLALL